MMSKVILFGVLIFYSNFVVSVPYPEELVQQRNYWPSNLSGNEHARIQYQNNGFTQKHNENHIKQLVGILPANNQEYNDNQAARSPNSNVYNNNPAVLPVPDKQLLPHFGSPGFKHELDSNPHRAPQNVAYAHNVDRSQINTNNKQLRNHNWNAQTQRPSSSYINKQEQPSYIPPTITNYGRQHNANPISLEYHNEAKENVANKEHIVRQTSLFRPNSPMTYEHLGVSNDNVLELGNEDYVKNTNPVASEATKVLSNSASERKHNTDESRKNNPYLIANRAQRNENYNFDAHKIEGSKLKQPDVLANEPGSKIYIDNNKARSKNVGPVNIYNAASQATANVAANNYENRRFIQIDRLGTQYRIPVIPLNINNNSPAKINYVETRNIQDSFLADRVASNYRESSPINNAGLIADVEVNHVPTVSPTVVEKPNDRRYAADKLTFIDQDIKFQNNNNLPVPENLRVNNIRHNGNDRQGFRQLNFGAIDDPKAFGKSLPNALGSSNDYSPENTRHIDDFRARLENRHYDPVNIHDNAPVVHNHNKANNHESSRYDRPGFENYNQSPLDNVPALINIVEEKNKAKQRQYIPENYRHIENYNDAVGNHNHIPNNQSPAAKEKQSQIPNSRFTDDNVGPSNIAPVLINDVPYNPEKRQYILDDRTRFDYRDPIPVFNHNNDPTVLEYVKNNPEDTKYFDNKRIFYGPLKTYNDALQVISELETNKREKQIVANDYEPISPNRERYTYDNTPIIHEISEKIENRKYNTEISPNYKLEDQATFNKNNVATNVPRDTVNSIAGNTNPEIQNRPQPGLLKPVFTDISNSDRIAPHQLPTEEQSLKKVSSNKFHFVLVQPDGTLKDLNNVDSKINKKYNNDIVSNNYRQDKAVAETITKSSNNFPNSNTTITSPVPINTYINKNINKEFANKDYQQKPHVEEIYKTQSQGVPMPNLIATSPPALEKDNVLPTHTNLPVNNNDLNLSSPVRKDNEFQSLPLTLPAIIPESLPIQSNDNAPPNLIATRPPVPEKGNVLPTHTNLPVNNNDLNLISPVKNDTEFHSLPLTLPAIIPESLPIQSNDNAPPNLIATSPPVPDKDNVLPIHTNLPVNNNDLNLISPVNKDTEFHSLPLTLPAIIPESLPIQSNDNATPNLIATSPPVPDKDNVLPIHTNLPVNNNDLNLISPVKIDTEFHSLPLTLPAIISESLLIQSIDNESDSNKALLPNDFTTDVTTPYPYVTELITDNLYDYLATTTVAPITESSTVLKNYDNGKENKVQNDNTNNTSSVDPSQNYYTNITESEITSELLRKNSHNVITEGIVTNNNFTQTEDKTDVQQITHHSKEAQLIDYNSDPNGDVLTRGDDQIIENTDTICDITNDNILESKPSPRGIKLVLEPSSVYDDDTIAIAIELSEPKVLSKSGVQVKVSPRNSADGFSNEVLNSREDYPNVNGKPTVSLRKSNNHINRNYENEIEPYPIYYFPTEPQPVMEKETHITQYPNGTVVTVITEVVYDNQEGTPPKITRTEKIAEHKDQ